MMLTHGGYCFHGAGQIMGKEIVYLQVDFVLNIITTDIVVQGNKGHPKSLFKSSLKAEILGGNINTTFTLFCVNLSIYINILKNLTNKTYKQRCL